MTPSAPNPVDRSRILGLTLFGDPFDRRSWSGSNWSLFSTLQKGGRLAGAYSVDLSRPQKMASALLNFSFNPRTIYLDMMKSRHSFAWRSRNANAILARHAGAFDWVLQVSALFLPRRQASVMNCSYHDGNTAVSRRPEFAAFMSAASAQVMKESWEYEMKFYQEMDLIFTMSEWVRQSMISDFKVPEEKVVAVGAGVNFSEPIPQDAGSLRDPSSKAILFVGTNFEFKGGRVTLEAFREVRREVPQAELWIVGCSPQLDEPGVRVIGTLDKVDPAQEAELRRLYGAASVFVLPTLYDAFGIAYVEAMYHRLPCIGSNRCAVPEIIADGETGFLVDPADADGLAKQMLLLLRDEKLSAKMGAAGLARARERFSWDQVVERMLAAMESARK